jgi:predicted transcriptional regulator
MSISVRLKPEAEIRLHQAISKTGKPRNALINEAVMGWFQGEEYTATDRAAIIRERRKKFSDIEEFNEREVTAEGRKW